MNPAVTFSLLLMGRLGAADFLACIGAQIVGGGTAAVLLPYALPFPAKSTPLELVDGTTDLQAWVVSLLASCSFVLLVLLTNFRGHGSVQCSPAAAHRKASGAEPDFDQCKTQQRARGVASIRVHMCDMGMLSSMVHGHIRARPHHTTRSFR